MKGALTIRPVEAPEEIQAFSLLATRTFVPEIEPESGAARWTRSLESMEEFRPEQRRGAFLDGAYAGGYMIYERTLRIGVAPVLTGCIGAVAVLPEHRGQGIASALLRDALAFAQERRHALLLLDGIPHFYHRFGYMDVFDLTEAAIARAAVAAATDEGAFVRPATQEDAEALLALYERHYGPYTGSFTRTLGQQTHQLRERLAENPPLLAIGPSGQPEGYLLLTREPDRARAWEVAADTWPAALGLLRRHAEMAGAAETVFWHLPPDAPTLYLLADHLDLPAPAPDIFPNFLWAVRSATYHDRDAAWMARLVRLRVLAAALVPEWQARWRRGLAQWSGNIELAVGDERCALRLEGETVRLLESEPVGDEVARLTPEVFTQLLFGYRPIDWAARQPGQQIPEQLLAPFRVLFPPGHVWIAASDSF
jgi:predicted N-acetyltransferase YhbS